MVVFFTNEERRMKPFNPTREPTPNENGKFSTFFGPIETKKFDFSYKPMRMPIIAFRELEMAKKDFL